MLYKPFRTPMYKKICNHADRNGKGFSVTDNQITQQVLKSIKSQQNLVDKPGVPTPPINLCGERNTASLYTRLWS